MAARPIWKGYLKLSLVSVPVKAYTVADSSQNSIQLNQLHAPCHHRIRYHKVCPEHGEVPNDEIVMGYQIGKDQYVPIDPDELSALRPQNDQAIEIDSFIATDRLDDRYLTDRSYFLVPDGKVAHKPYCLIRDAMGQAERRAVAEVILSRREQHVVIRPLGKLLIMTVLQHHNELKQPSTFEDQVEEVAAAKQELHMARQLVDGLTPDDWDYSKYIDDYQRRLGELIEAKVAGKELVKAPEAAAPQIINLMDALKASIEQIPLPKSASPPATAKDTDADTAGAGGTAAKPKRRAAASKPRTASKRKTTKRKTG